MVDPARREVDIETFARLAHDAALRQEGVSGMATAGIAEKLGVRKAAGVAARLDQDGWLHLDVSIVAVRGEDLLHVGSRVQEAVIAAVREASDQPMGPVNVHVTQRGKSPEPETAMKQDQRVQES